MWVFSVKPMRPDCCISGGARFCGFLWALLALPACANEPLPSPRSTDPAIAAALEYEYGTGVAANPGRAAEMYCTAARQGNADAAYRLGWMYATGSSVEHDERHATALFQRAAAQGHELATRALEATGSGEARLPLCITPPPPPVVAVESEIGSAQPAPSRREKAETSAAKIADAGTLAAVAPGPPATPSVSDQILFAIARWADAWSQRDVDSYLAAYAPGFQTRAGESRQQWEAHRRSRILDKAWIYIGVRNLTVTIEGDQAKARFVQDYRSDKGHESATKILTLVPSAQSWLIRQEQSDPLPLPTMAR